MESEFMRATFNIEKKQKEMLDKVNDQMGIPLSYIVRQAIDVYMEQYHSWAIDELKEG